MEGWRPARGGGAVDANRGCRGDGGRRPWPGAACGRWTARLRRPSFFRVAIRPIRMPKENRESMTVTLKDMMAAANAAVERIDTAGAQALMAERGALLLDVRDAPEIDKTGRAAGAHHIPRGMLEFRADPDSPFHDPQLRKDRPVVLHCASGGRAALAGKLLKDMGYAEVFNLGGLKDWIDGGGATTEPVDPGM